ncbi:autoinducer binding domain-containing protein [Pseudomonas sp. HLS-6]|uniref:autoinducer binding domain-containing protein n=1 Tax=Pseudomonas sp. HLS-6 TaxID=2049589 RepID=UPI002114D749|nr:autoinducer binding domain-containing protein [Pseudomonas sp. HLS-6]
MPYWNQEQMQQLLNEHNEQQLFEIALSLAKQLGMDFLGFTIRRHVATQSPQYILLNNFPSEWNTRYQPTGRLRQD